VIANPILFTRVSPDPTKSLGADKAIIVENCGESPDTVMPQKIKKDRNTKEDELNIMGDIKQQHPEQNSCIKATFALPTFLDIMPPRIQPTLPDARIINDQKNILNST
jgi:hypothetical protein